jgi:hypothetical protein
MVYEAPFANGRCGNFSKNGDAAYRRSALRRRLALFDVDSFAGEFVCGRIERCLLSCDLCGKPECMIFVDLVEKIHSVASVRLTFEEFTREIESPHPASKSTDVIILSKLTITEI